jgi:hypothetical protein
MSTLSKVSANKQTPSEIANSLNRQFYSPNLNFKESYHIRLSDYNDLLYIAKVKRIAMNVIGIIAGGFSLAINPGPAIIGGLFATISYTCDKKEREIKFIPKFEVENGEVVQVNGDSTNELHQQGLKISNFVFTDILCSGVLALSHVYPTSILGAPILTFLASFYLGSRVIDELHDISHKLFI